MRWTRDPEDTDDPWEDMNKGGKTYSLLVVLRKCKNISKKYISTHCTHVAALREI